MGNRKNRFNFFKFNKDKNDLNWSEVSKESDELSFPSFDSIIPENSPLKKNSSSSSGFINDDLNSKDKPDYDNGLDGVDEKYAKYIFSNDSGHGNDFENQRGHGLYKNSNYSDNPNNHNNPENSNNPPNSKNLEYSVNPYEAGNVNSEEALERGDDSNENLKIKLLKLKEKLSNKNNHSKTLFGKVTFVLIFLVLISSAFYFFVYQPFQDELNLERNSKLNEVNALYMGPLELNENAYSLKSQINQAYDIEEIKSIDVLMFATKDWRMYHSSKIVSCKDEFGRVMMSYGDEKSIIMSVKDANDFVSDNDAKVLSNVQFEKVNTVIVPVSLSRISSPDVS